MNDSARPAPMVSSEHDPRSVDGLLRHLVEATATVTGDAFFRALVRNVAEALGTRYAFVAEFAQVRTRVRTLAFWSRDGFIDNLEFDLNGTRCEAVLAGEICHYHRGLQGLFPKDIGLARLRAESYLAIPLADAAGNVLGHLAALDDKAMPAAPRDLSMPWFLIRH